MVSDTNSQPSSSASAAAGAEATPFLDASSVDERTEPTVVIEPRGRTERTPPDARSAGGSAPDVQQVTAVLREIASDKRVADWLTAAIADQADVRILERESRRHRQTLLVMSVIGLVGVGGLSALTSQLVGTAVQAAEERVNEHVDAGITASLATIEARLPEQFRTIVDTANDKLRSSMRRTAQYQRLAYLLVLLDNAEDGFTDDHRDAILGILRELEADPEVRRDPDFAAFLEKIIDPFHSAGLDAHIDEITDMFLDECLHSRGIVITLVEHYGLRLAGQFAEAKTWLQTPVDRFERFEAAARGFHLDGDALLLRVLVEQRRGGLEVSKGQRSRVQAAGAFRDAGDAADFIMGLAKFHRWSDLTRAINAAQVQEAARSVVEQYAAEINLLLDRGDVQEALAKRIARYESSESGGLLAQVVKQFMALPQWQ